jgi:hypothetical protein
MLMTYQKLQIIKNHKSKLIRFADNTSIIVTNPTATEFIKDINMTFKNINEWFKSNLLSLNFDKTNFMQFITKNSAHIDINIGCDNKLISSTSNLMVLGLIIDNTLTWKGHVEMIVPKLSAACFAVKSVKPFVSRDTFTVIYYSYFHSIMDYGLIFWGNSSCSNSIFKLQKRIIRIIMGAGTRDYYCRELFKILKVLPLRSQYIVSLVLFMVNNEKTF